MRYDKKARRFVAMLAWFLLVGGGILFLGCDQVQGLLGIGGGNSKEDNNEVPDVPPPPVAFRTYYVAASGNDTNGGTSEFPLKTVEGALGRLATDYAKENWPDKGDPNEEAGEIIIRGTVTASSAILINGTGYPSIVLRGESGSGSTLTWIGEADTDCLLNITNGARITLDEDLTLTRTTANVAMVYVGTDSAFTMNSGKIAGNSFSGRGVYVGDGGEFTMNDGTISGNTVTLAGNGGNGGGGVFNNGGAFTMNKGTISDNISDDTAGGVYNKYGVFTMNDGTISGNTAGYGGGVANMYGTFTMTGGTISDNSAISGGGVYNKDVFTMYGGTISGNTAENDGGGVSHKYRTFTMNEGTISGNSATYGGGVYVYTLSEFQKNSGGIIYGADGDTNTKNTASNQGHAVYVQKSGGNRIRNNTAGEGVLLNSGADGGWEN